MLVDLWREISIDEKSPSSWFIFRQQFWRGNETIMDTMVENATTHISDVTSSFKDCFQFDNYSLSPDCDDLLSFPTGETLDGGVVCQDPGQSYSLTISAILVALISFVSLTTVAGNALVILSFATDRKLRSFGNYFILNLAISDLIVGLLIAIYLPYILRGCWQLTRIGCLIFTFLDYVVPLASAWNMALISLDRYWSVARAIEYRLRMNSRKAVFFMTVPWIAGTLWYGPTVLFWSQITGNTSVPEGKCMVEFFNRATYLIMSSAVEFVLPFVIVATINILLYLNIRQRSCNLLSATRAVSGPTGTMTVQPTSDNQTTLKAKTILSRDKKSARSLAILVIVFLITWAPFEICAFVNPMCNFCIPDSASEVVFWLLWLNSTINPILYPFLQQRFRIAFLRILCRFSKRFRVLEGETMTTDRRTVTNVKSKKLVESTAQWRAFSIHFLSCSRGDIHPSIPPQRYVLLDHPSFPSLLWYTIVNDLPLDCHIQWSNLHGF